ncbi:hypothetical protein AMS68_003995 [Peltaster fructicola]|uniref:WIBG Mago-binding domain-containing protein n=1 Tax=Peltaster fructicola TaxID=286661 RepID=A0A6H0XV39_9PEZI|nr:hypothetical protein AMS68_003995 [Peltaster fructicola]
MSGTSPAGLSNSGIKKLRNGESVIPSSTRADGSVRKEIRVKPGYRPPEDVEVYKNRTAEAWKNRGKGGVPGAEAASSETQAQQLSASALKNAKRRDARKKAAANTSEEGEKTDVDVVKVMEPVPDIDPEAEQAKEARKLAKKLRQARDLQDKKNEGSSLLPEQLAKVIKINELIRQLDNLGFDTDGEKKQVEAEGHD